MTKGCKIWLWIVFVSGILDAGISMSAMVVDPKLGIYSMFASAAVITGVVLLLFKQRKIGLYIIIAIAAINFVYNVSNGLNVLYALFLATLSPAITCYLVHKNSDEFI